MNSFVILGILALMAAFGAVLYLNNNAEASGQPQLSFSPPYHFKVGDTLSEVNAFLFVVILSAAFFGLASPIALGMEGLKYGSLFSTHAMPLYDLSFAVPQVLAAVAVSFVGQGAIEDYQGKGTVFTYWRSAVKWFAAGVVLLIVLIATRGYFISA
ncbi:TPA: hypothetical protein HA244_03810 [Candidatus Micrarchaeota archaeon]|nr:hypothetical protein [Candidatus Micrarchaeota archaeon]